MARILAFQDGVPFDGTYEIRFKAEAVNRLHPYDPEFIGTDRDEPFRLGIVAGNLAVGPLYKPQPIEPLLAEVELTDEPRWYTVRVWLDAGFTPRFTFRNGMMDVRKKWTPLVKRYADQFPAPVRGGIAEARLYAIKDGKLPQIRIHEVEIEGPFLDVVADRGAACGARGRLGGRERDRRALRRRPMRRHLTEFTSRAYRRPARAEEIDRLLRLIAVRRESGRSPLEAYRDGLSAVLCSPGFLVPRRTRRRRGCLRTRWPPGSRISSGPRCPTRAAPGPRGERRRCTSRPSWRSRPAGCSADPRSAGFIDGFLDSWLALRDLGSMPPDRSKFERLLPLRPRDLDAPGDATLHAAPARQQPEHRELPRLRLHVRRRAAREALRAGAAAWPRIREGRASRDRRRGGLLGQASVLTRDRQRHRHLSRGPRHLAAREHPRHAAVPAPARCRAARPGHPRRHDHPRTAREAPEHRHLLRVSSEDRPARLRAGEFRRDRLLARPLRAVGRRQGACDRPRGPAPRRPGVRGRRGTEDPPGPARGPVRALPDREAPRLLHGPHPVDRRPTARGPHRRRSPSRRATG